MTIGEYRKIYDTVYKESDADKKKGFQGWQHKARITRAALMEVQKKIDADLDELRHTYNEKTVQGFYAEMMNDYATLKGIAKKRLLDSLEEVVNGKREQYKKIALSAPSAEQLRLIQTLSLRDDLTGAEVAAVAESLGDNLQALRALGSVARRNGLDFPNYGSIEEFETALENATQCCKDTLYDLDTKDLGYFSTCFYNYEGRGKPYALFAPLDQPLFAAVQVQKEQSAEDKKNSGDKKAEDHHKN